MSDRVRDVVSTCDDRRDEQDDERVDVRIGEKRGKHGLVGGRRRRAEEVDRIRDACLEREMPRELAPCRFRESWQLEARRLARVCAEDPKPARVRDDADAATGGKRLAREQRSCVDELLQGTRTQDAGIAEERVDRDIRAGERCGMRARRPRTGACRSGLEREDRLLARHALRQPAELARVAERLQI